MSQATDRLSASISAFAVSLNTFMSRPIPEDDTAALNAAADQIDALKAKLDAVTPPATPAVA